MQTRLYTAPPQEDLFTPFTEGAATAGMNSNVPLYNMPAGTAVYLYNLDPAAYGGRTREGSVCWAQNLQGTNVKSLVPFLGLQSGQERLFAVSQIGIFDISTQGQDNPTPVVTFGDQSDPAGFTSYHTVTSPAGGQTIYVADSRNGLYEYNPIGASWTKITTEITGVDPTKVAFVMGHKNRLWFIERDSADAWYLPIGQKTGAAVKFQFGSKMRQGGYLVGRYNYSVDGGRGLVDYLIAVSKGGDVLAYQGSDPSSSTSWNLVGNWFIGDVPAGRRVGTESGGDLWLLSTFGLTSAGDLLRGIDPSRIERNITGNISRLIADQMTNKLNDLYWEIRALPEERVFAINSPRRADERHIQYVLNTEKTTEGSGGGWGLWRDVRALCFEAYQGNAYFGTDDGKVFRMFGSLDEVDIQGNGGNAVEFSSLSRFTDFGVYARYKQVQWIRPTFLSNNQVSLTSKAVYDFNIDEIVDQPTASSLIGSRWDVDKWDKAVWTGSTISRRLFGAGGYGVNVAIAIKGSVISRATHLSTEGAWQPWGII